MTFGVTQDYPKGQMSPFFETSSNQFFASDKVCQDTKTKLLHSYIEYFVEWNLKNETCTMKIEEWNF